MPLAPLIDELGYVYRVPPQEKPRLLDIKFGEERKLDC
jgi:hypothetical protein